MNYQSLSSYNGNLYGAPRYQGLEYDVEVPDTQIIQSPGGAASTFHHWSKGFYGNGRSDSTKFGFQGYRTEYGINGNLYQPGPGAADTLGMYPKPIQDPQYWNNQTQPPNLKDMEDQSFFFDSLKPAKLEMPKDIKKDNIIEKFTDDSNNDSKLSKIIYFIMSVLSIVIFTLFGIKYYEQTYGRQIPPRILLTLGGVALIITIIIYWMKIA